MKKLTFLNKLQRKDVWTMVTNAVVKIANRRTPIIIIQKVKQISNETSKDKISGA